VFDGAHVESRVTPGPGALVVEDRPTVALLDAEARDRFSADAIRSFVDAGGAVVLLGRPDDVDVPDLLPVDLLAGYVPHPWTPRRLLLVVRAAFRESAVGICMKMLRSLPPASISSTRCSPLSLRRSASTQPAEPAPTIM
jgi:hypothetical protein